MTPRPGPSARRRDGASLVLVLAAAVTVVSLVLATASLVRVRSRRADRAATRARLRTEAESALSGMVFLLEADTNGVDHLGEDWAAASAKAAEALRAKRDGAFAVAADERALLSFPASGEPSVAALLAQAFGADAARAVGEARALFSWWETASAAGIPGVATNRVLGAAEELFAAPTGDRALLRKALPFLSVHGDGSFNANTAGRETVVAAALAGGADEGGAEGLWTRLEMSRARGEVFERATEDEAVKLLRGEGDNPSPAEMRALLAVRPLLRTDTDLFRIVAVARRGDLSRTIRCVYHRGSRVFLSWAETD